MELFIKLSIMMFVILSCIVFIVSSSSGCVFVNEIKLFDAVNFNTVTDVVKTTGKDANSSAYIFGSKSSDIITNTNVSCQFALGAFLMKDFTIKGCLKSTSLERMAIISFYQGKATFFDLLFSWVSSTEVKFSVDYLSDTNQELTITSDKIQLDQLSNNNWLCFTVRVHVLEKLIRFGINDKFFVHKEIDALKKFPNDGTLRLAQRIIYGNENIKKIEYRFVGDLQDLAIRFGDPSCNEAPVCPVTDMVSTITDPTRAPQGVNDECIGDNGIKYKNDDEWKEGSCVKCSCKLGKTRCMQFCKTCNHEGQYYLDKAEWDDSFCNQCSCKGGTVSCKSGSGKVIISDGCLRTCSDSKKDKCPHKTHRGCFCPGDMVFLDGKCQNRMFCSCDHNGKLYAPGYGNFDSRNCLFCKCLEGVYKCEKWC